MGMVEGLMLAAMAATAAAQIKGGIDAKAAYDYNAAVAEQEAGFQKKRTKHELAFQREEVERIIGKARVVSGGSGVEASQSILHGTLTEAAIDEQLIRTQGAINVWRAKSQSKQLSQTGEDFRTAGYIRGGTTILGGLSRYDYRRKKR
jgi:hypothetical protein